MNQNEVSLCLKQEQISGDGVRKLADISQTHFILIHFSVLISSIYLDWRIFRYLCWKTAGQTMRNSVGVNELQNQCAIETNGDFCYCC